MEIEKDSCQETFVMMMWNVFIMLFIKELNAYITTTIVTTTNSKRYLDQVVVMLYNSWNFLMVTNL